MPGPGGGSHGGGFGGGSRGGGGGFGGGGFGGGGFGGGHHHGPHHHGPHHHGPFFGGWYHRPYYGYGGGGCLGGLMGILLLPIILLLIVGIMLTSIIGSAVANVKNGGSISYNEQVFQDYANERYAQEFSSYSNYENNILIVFLTNEEADGYYTIAWVGDNIHTDINYMFGDETTAFGQVVLGSINREYYKYSLSSNLANIMDTMASKIESRNLPSSFRVVNESHNPPTSHLSNYSSLAISEETVNAALVSFTEKTDIPAVIVVDTMENVFGKNIPIGDIIIVIALLALMVLAIVLIVRGIKNRKNNGGSNNNNNNNNSNNNNNNSGYNTSSSGYNTGYNSGSYRR